MTASASRRGLMLAVSSPSGAGKTSLTRHVLQADPQIRPSISVTTRPRRPSEVDGVDYHFLPSLGQFEGMRAAGELLEWAEVHGNYYGTPRQPVEEALNAGRDVLFDIDWQGTEQLRQKMPDDIVTVFVLPPAAQELKARLERRNEDAPQVIQRRLVNAQIEIPHWVDYDYVIVNDDLNRSYEQLRCILTAERLKRVRRPELAPLVRDLLTQLAALAGPA